MPGSCDVWESQCVDVAESKNCGVRELPFALTAKAMQELRSKRVALSGTRSTRELWSVGVALGGS